MKVVTAKEMMEIDRITIEDVGIPQVVLMERAGLAVAKRIMEKFSPQPITVICGGGNNGGDGLVAARELYNNGFCVQVFMAAELASLSDPCRFQLELLKKYNAEILTKPIVRESDIVGNIIVDAMIGTGLTKQVKDTMAKTIDYINSSGCFIFSVDIPSGISSDTGEILGRAVKASCTVTFGLPKRGHLLHPGRDYTGELFVEDIGFPRSLLTDESITCETVEKNLVSMFLPNRPDYSYKGNYGHVLFIGGARGKTGAIVMAAKAAMRSGSGLVTIGVPSSLLDSYQSRVTEEMTLPVADKGKGRFSKKALTEILDFAEKRCDIIAIGPGMGVDTDTVELVRELIVNSPVPIVLDADGINSLSALKYQDRINILNTSPTPVTITPHTAEMARLVLEGKTSNLSPKCMEIEKDRVGEASKFSAHSTSYLILKGVPTITADPEGNTFINPTGSPAMATSGAGDVLTGIISSFSGQGLPPLYAALLGVYLHGMAGEIAADKIGVYSTIASDLIDYIPLAINYLTGTEK
ncbi:NAD(P)H-hydrate dehydratase [Candidatus Magnetomonas plexicatena]|uniref:NAD(P)H-hydrate dehydratase n=1 Tax=Candidatus Magnetomonas plexicatena TaxID=2552947 RepID=UPI001C75D025|nr:NAD(P)H-hydrate dehydratase [Nitrospirales bacterium LBB_01]